MTKPPEEGEIWEWRAFGPVVGVAQKVQTYPLRYGIVSQRDEDIYLISPRSDQNIKLRQSAGKWLLKFKLLVAVGRRSIERYRESADLTFELPVEAERLKEAARLLNADLTERPREDIRFDKDEILQCLASPVVSVRVPKVRTQFQVDGGWIELADAAFPKRKVQSLSIHSRELEVVERVLDSLGPGDELEVMNYVQACRLWG